MRTFFKLVSFVLLLVSVFMFWQIGGAKLAIAVWLLVTAIGMEIDSSSHEVYRSVVKLIDRVVSGYAG